MEEEESRKPPKRWNSSSPRRKIHLNSSSGAHQKGIRRSSSLDQRRDIGSSRKRGSQLDRELTVSGLVPEDVVRLGGSVGGKPIQPLESSDTSNGLEAKQARGIEAMKAWRGSASWAARKRSGSIPNPLASPRTVPMPAKHDRLARALIRQSGSIRGTMPTPDSPTSRFRTGRHTSELQRSMSEKFESSHDREACGLRFASITGRIEHMTISAGENNSHSPDPNVRDGKDRGLNLQGLDAGDVLPDDDGVIYIESDLRNFSEEQRSDQDAVSVKGRKPAKAGTSSETPHPSHSNERDGLKSQSQPSESEPTLVDANSVRDRVRQQLDPETDGLKEVPKTTQSPGNLQSQRHDSKPKSLGSDHKEDAAPQDQSINRDTAHFPGAMESKGPNSQHKSFGGDPAKSLGPLYNSPRTEPLQASEPQSMSPNNDRPKRPNSKSQSPKPQPQGIADETDPTEGQAGEDVKPEAWFNNNAPLPGNYKAFRRDSPIPESRSPRHSRGSVDSLVISPTRTEEYSKREEEDWDGIARENAENMNIFNKYRAEVQLKPTFDEEEKRRAARAAEKEAKRNARRRRNSFLSMSTLSSDGSLIISPGQYDEKRVPQTEPEPDPFQKAEEEEENQAALHRIELYRMNYELQRTLEAKEAQFKRDIQIAWTHPRPPTTHEEHLDRIALQKIESKEMFDEFGEPQRPIRTDPRLISRETQINMMLMNARIQHLLGDYRQMYNHVNHAAVAASKLDFAPFTARCYFYRGLAMYLHRNFSSAKDDFVKARDCAGRYGISKESIERYIYLIDSADDEETAILETFPRRQARTTRKAERRGGSRCRDVDRANGSSPPPPDYADTLFDDSPSSPSIHGDSAQSPNGSTILEEQSTGQTSEDGDSQIQTPRHPNPSGGRLPVHNIQPATNDILNYRPQDEAVSEEVRKDIEESKARRQRSVIESYQPRDIAVSEEVRRDRQESRARRQAGVIPSYQPRDEAIFEDIRKDIQESKARSLSRVSENAIPAVDANLPGGGVTLPPSSMANTEWTLLGSNTTPGTERRVPRPHVAPITTSFASPQATPGAGNSEEKDSDLMDPEEIYACFGGRPGGGREDTGSGSNSDSDTDLDSDSVERSSSRRSGR